MLAVVLPLYGPAPCFHTSYEGFFACRQHGDFHNGNGTVSDITSFGAISKKVVLVLIPGTDFAIFDPGPIKMPPFLSDRESSFFTQGICELFLPFKVKLCLMQFFAIDIGNSVRHYVAVQMVFVLMHAD